MVIVGRLKIPYNDLFVCNLDERNALIEGHRLDIHEMYEASRLGAYLSILPHIDRKKTSNLTPQKLFPFYWEKDITVSKPTIKEDLEHGEKLLELIKQGKKIPKYGKS